MVYKGVTKEQIDEIFGRVKKKDPIWPNDPPLVKHQITVGIDFADLNSPLSYYCPYCKSSSCKL